MARNFYCLLLHYNTVLPRCLFVRLCAWVWMNMSHSFNTPAVWDSASKILCRSCIETIVITHNAIKLQGVIFSWFIYNKIYTRIKQSNNLYCSHLNFVNPLKIFFKLGIHWSQTQTIHHAMSCKKTATINDIVTRS